MLLSQIKGKYSTRILDWLSCSISYLIIIGASPVLMYELYAVKNTRQDVTPLKFHVTIYHESNLS